MGEIKALRWREDVDTIAKVLTVNQQTSWKKTGMPKGRTRRTVPMTATVHEVLEQMSVVREGFVVRNLDAKHKTDTQAVRALEQGRAGSADHRDPLGSRGKDGSR